METGCRRLHRTPRRALRGLPLEHGCQDLLPALRIIMAHLDESRWSGWEPLPSLFENSSSGIELNTKAHAATHRELSHLDRSVINLLKTEGLQVRIFNDARPGSASQRVRIGPVFNALPAGFRQRRLWEPDEAPPIDGDRLHGFGPPSLDASQRCCRWCCTNGPIPSPELGSSRRSARLCIGPPTRAQSRVVPLRGPPLLFLSI
jgi:hypothetical protein